MPLNSVLERPLQEYQAQRSALRINLDVSSDAVRRVEKPLEIAVFGRHLLAVR